MNDMKHETCLIIKICKEELVKDTKTTYEAFAKITEKQLISPGRLMRLLQ